MHPTVVRLFALALTVAGTGAGCTPNAAALAEALCKNQVSACVTITTIYGTAKAACSGLLNGTIVCGADGMSIKAREPSP